MIIIVVLQCAFQSVVHELERVAVVVCPIPTAQNQCLRLQTNSLFVGCTLHASENSMKILYGIKIISQKMKR